MTSDVSWPRHVVSVMTQTQLSGHSGQPGAGERRARTGETQTQVARSAHARIFTHMAAAQQCQDTIREDIYYAGRREESINFTYMHWFWLENCWTCFESKAQKSKLLTILSKNQWMQEKTRWDKWQVNNPGWERWEIVFSQSQALLSSKLIILTKSNWNFELNHFIQGKLLIFFIFFPIYSSVFHWRIDLDMKRIMNEESSPPGV